jgi:hypothetical protein
MNTLKWFALAAAFALAGCAQDSTKAGTVLAGAPISPTSVAAGPTIVNGGGTGTFNPADLDGDGDIDGSHFGFGVTIRPGGSAQGHFMCQMAGNADFLDLKLMLVEGRVTSASITSTGAEFGSDNGTVNLGNGTVVRGVGFVVSVTPGGPGVGTMQLTVLAPPFDGVPGDTTLGDNKYSLPIETVATGSISIR